MTRESILMQYQSECLSALKSVANLHINSGFLHRFDKKVKAFFRGNIRKPLEKVFMDAMKLFMDIPGRINFLQMGRYGCFF